MPTPVSQILRRATRGDAPLNVFCIGTAHERYEALLARTGHDFYVRGGEGINPWNAAASPVPPNFTFYDDVVQLSDVVPDLVLSHGRHAHFEAHKAFAATYDCPHVNVQHIYPHPSYPGTMHPSLAVDLDVYITEHSRDTWGPLGANAIVPQAVDAEAFHPQEGGAVPQVLAVVNRFKERGEETGYGIWRAATDGLPTQVLGDNPGLSRPAADLRDLASHYRRSLVFANTATRSTFPLSLLEAMASGCCVVTCPSPVIRTFVDHGVNGFLCETAEAMRAAIQQLLENPSMAREVGARGRATAIERFPVDKFVSSWDGLLKHAADMEIA